MRIGIDLDNTLADYRRPLERLCERHGVPGHHADPKLALRGALRARGEEGLWTSLQGELYGPLMSEAQLFAGAGEVIGGLRASGCELVIVSHRTRHPLAGEPHDLHAHARRWLQGRGLGSIEVFFEESKEAKIARLAQLDCRLFVDDLPEILLHADFPSGVRKILFDPGASHEVQPSLERAVTWAEVGTLIGA